MNELCGNKNEKLILLFLLLYAATAWMFDGDESNIRYVYLVYGLLCLAILIYSLRFNIYRETYPLIGYMLFGFLSILWAEDRETAFTRSRGVLLLMIGFILLYSFIRKTGKPQILLIAAIGGATALSLYVFYSYGITGVIAAIANGEIRIGGRINNENAIAHSLSVGIVAIIGMALFFKKRWLLLLLIPIGLIFLAAGSRMAALSALAGILVTFFMYIRTRKNESSRIANLLLILFVAVILWAVLRNIPAFQELLLRFENSFTILFGGQSFLKEQSTQERLDFIRLGWQQFLESPVVGNGIGCAGYAILEKYGKITYLHNNYMEMLASGGIIGFFLWYTPYFVVLKNHFVRVFKFGEKTAIVNISFALLITKLVAHMGTVVYYSKIEYLLIALWLAVSFIPGDQIEKG